MQNPTITIRIDKFLANMGVTSRRNVPIFLQQNMVTVNGKKVLEHGERIDPKKDVLINGAALSKPKTMYIALHKPLGIISTAKDELGRDTVVSMVDAKERLYPVGRLDKNTTGLLLLTNDGDLANKLSHPRYHTPKTYQLVISGKISANTLRRMRDGVMLEDGMTAPATIESVKTMNNETILHVVLFEGKKRQIRRMCEVLHLELVALKRIAIGNLLLGNLKEGSFRNLTSEEISELKSTDHK
jgi:23S rRNA pseudouridine2605 synthase